MSGSTPLEVTVLGHLDTLHPATYASAADVVSYLQKSNFVDASQIRSAMQSLFDRTWVEAYENTPDSGLFRISAKGQIQLQRLQSVGAHVPPTFTQPTEIAPTDPSHIPASDRVVSLNHNSVEYWHIRDELTRLSEEVRSNNQIGDTPEDQDRIVRSIKAASELWAAYELKIVQIKVVIIMAIEDAVNALIKVGKAGAWSLLIDAVKNFFKSTSGLDI